jgi:hypothetical protein
MSERPGVDIGEPTQQHIVLAMLILIDMTQPGRERECLWVGLVLAAEAMWNWNEERLRDELSAALGAMVQARSRLTVWFTAKQMEFDMNVPGSAEQATRVPGQQ